MLTASQFKILVKTELSRLSEGCGEEAAGGSECSSCASGGGCGCSGHGQEEVMPPYDVVYSSDIPHPDEIVSAYSDELIPSMDSYERGEYGTDPMYEPAGHISREETLDMVEELANMTSCSKTRQALLGVVDQLEYMTGESGEELEQYLEPEMINGTAAEEDIIELSRRPGG